MTAKISVALSSAPGPRRVSVTNASPGGGTFTLEEGFTIASALSSAADLPSERVPIDFVLADAYPNPFNSVVTIQFGLPEHADVQIQICNLLGVVVSDVFLGEKGPGFHQIPWVADGHPSGVYFIRWNAHSRISQRHSRVFKKIVFLK
jgi:hypothetical protein